MLQSSPTDLDLTTFFVFLLFLLRAGCSPRLPVVFVLIESRITVNAKSRACR